LVLALAVIPISMMGVLLAREASTAEQTARDPLANGALQELQAIMRVAGHRKIPPGDQRQRVIDA
jgi:hypothetical protein